MSAAETLDAPAFDGATFRHVLGHYPTGVCLVTAIDETEAPVGMIVGSFTSVSLAPPLVAFLPQLTSTTWPRIERAGRFAVNVLAGDQQDLCDRFGSRGARFEGLDHRLSAGGAPILDGVIAWIDCRIEAVHPAGDHLIVLGRVEALAAERDAPPLVFCRSAYSAVAPAS